MCRIVYSYERFSSKKQEFGDSVIRQQSYRDKYMSLHPDYVLDNTFQLRDYGRSAFRGSNLDRSKGDLGKFIAICHMPDSPIKKGSILLLESLDRFSRMPPSKSQKIFYELIDCGIAVQTMMPEQYIDANNINEMGTLMQVTAYLHMAWQYSQNLSVRISKRWASMRKKATEGQVFAQNCPGWLEWDGKKYQIKDGHDKTIKFIFRRTLDGIGQKRLITELNEKGYCSWGDSGKWNNSVLIKLLKEKTVCGFWTPCEGEPVPNFYPQIIDEQTWNRAQQAKGRRYQNRGSAGEFVNLFTHLLYSVDDKCPIHVTTIQPRKGKIDRRLVSYNHVRRVKGATPHSLTYHVFEQCILGFTGWLKPEHIAPSENNSTADELKRMEDEYEGICKKLRKLQKLLEDDPTETGLKAASQLEKKRDAMQKTLIELRQKVLISAVPITEVQEIIPLLQNGSKDVRAKARVAIAEVIECINISMYKTGRYTGAHCEVVFRNGTRRKITINPEGRNMVVRPSKEEWHGMFFDHDLVFCSVPFGRQYE